MSRDKSICKTNIRFLKAFKTNRVSEAYQAIFICFDFKRISFTRNLFLKQITKTVIFRTKYTNFQHAWKKLCFPTCTVSRTTKHEGIRIFQIPMRNDDFYSKWRSDIMAVVSKYRELNKHLKERTLAGRIYICERHFPPEDIEFTSKFS